jgi:hypothetical protein
MKFAGLGLSQVLVLWLVFSLVTVGMKAIVNKYPVAGLSEVVNTI